MMSFGRRYVTELVWFLVLMAVLCFLPADARSGDERMVLDAAGGCVDDWDDCGYLPFLPSLPQ
jgi:hypothetical protein